MPKKLLCVLLALLCLCCSSCSKIFDLLDKAGGGDLKEKLDTAWSEVGKDELDNFADDIWREYGFGKSLGWPDTGNGSSLPKLRDGDTEYSFASEDGKCGCIKTSGVTDEEYEAYISDLEEIGYTESLTNSTLDEVYVCKGLYAGFLRDGETLYICYAGTADEIDDVYTAARNQNDDK